MVAGRGKMATLVYVSCINRPVKPKESRLMAESWDKQLVLANLGTRQEVIF